jgi:hypothetical protein
MVQANAPESIASIVWQCVHQGSLPSSAGNNLDAFADRFDACLSWWGIGWRLLISLDFGRVVMEWSVWILPMRLLRVVWLIWWRIGFCTIKKDELEDPESICLEGGARASVLQREDRELCLNTSLVAFSMKLSYLTRGCISSFGAL